MPPSDNVPDGIVADNVEPEAALDVVVLPSVEPPVAAHSKFAETDAPSGSVMTALSVGVVVLKYGADEPVTHGAEGTVDWALAVAKAV